MTTIPSQRSDALFMIINEKPREIFIRVLPNLTKIARDNELLKENRPNQRLSTRN